MNSREIIAGLRKISLSAEAGLGSCGMARFTCARRSAAYKGKGSMSKIASANGSGKGQIVGPEPIMELVCGAGWSNSTRAK
jgi:hypothetical protein